MTAPSTTGQACPGSVHLTGGFREHIHVVECRGDLVADEERHHHRVHLARCLPTGHLCTACATDWPLVKPRHRLTNPPPNEFAQHVAADSAKRIKAALDERARRNRERATRHLEKDH